MKVAFWAVPVLAAVASCFVGCADAIELGDKGKRSRSQGSQSEGKRSRSRSSSRKGVPVQGVWDFVKLLDRTEKRDVLVFLEETGRGALGKELLKSLNDVTREHIQTDLRRMGVGQGRRRDSSGSKKSPEELTDLLNKFDSEDAREVAYRLLTPEDQENIMRIMKPGKVFDFPPLADVPVKAVIKLAKLTDSEKLEVFEYLQETGRGAMLEELLNSLNDVTREHIQTDLRRMGKASERLRDSSGSRISPEELRMDQFNLLGKKVQKAAYEFMTPEEQDEALQGLFLEELLGSIDESLRVGKRQKSSSRSKNA